MWKKNEKLLFSNAGHLWPLGGELNNGICVSVSVSLCNSTFQISEVFKIHLQIISPTSVNSICEEFIIGILNPSKALTENCQCIKPLCKGPVNSLWLIIRIRRLLP